MSMNHAYKVSPVHLFHSPGVDHQTHLNLHNYQHTETGPCRNLTSGGSVRIPDNKKEYMTGVFTPGAKRNSLGQANEDVLKGGP
jgi:hypothetical protein